MESIPPEYIIAIYIIMALPFVIAALGVTSLIVVGILYFTNHRKTALKLLKIIGIVVLVLIAFSWLTKASLGF
ncbi:TPA: hypothetical protein DEW05_01540 [Candidatus Saccharibacteria bacterium]|nr:hypothetical protein [Candidatus Saccharibacteria bacterium]